MGSGIWKLFDSVTLEDGSWFDISLWELPADSVVCSRSVVSCSLCSSNVMVDVWESRISVSFPMVALVDSICAHGSDEVLQNSRMKSENKTKKDYCPKRHRCIILRKKSQACILRNKSVATHYVINHCWVYFHGNVFRLAKIDLVTIFDCDYRWYCTIDYVIPVVNYIGIHHLFYYIQWLFSH